MKTCRRNRAQAFTLIELLLVMVILTILAAVVVPKFTNRSEQARETATKTDIANLEIALDSYEIDTGKYPSTDEGLEALIDEPSSSITNWRGPYIKKGIPKDAWGNSYVYKYPGDHNENGYDLYSYGSDGKSGTDDDIVNWSDDSK